MVSSSLWEYSLYLDSFVSAISLIDPHHWSAASRQLLLSSPRPPSPNMAHECLSLNLWQLWDFGNSILLYSHPATNLLSGDLVTNNGSILDHLPSLKLYLKIFMYQARQEFGDSQTDLLSNNKVLSFNSNLFLWLEAEMFLETSCRSLSEKWWNWKTCIHRIRI